MGLSNLQGQSPFSFATAAEIADTQTVYLAYQNQIDQTQVKVIQLK